METLETWNLYRKHTKSETQEVSETWSTYIYIIENVLQSFQLTAFLKSGGFVLKTA